MCNDSLHFIFCMAMRPKIHRPDRSILALHTVTQKSVVASQQVRWISASASDATQQRVMSSTEPGFGRVAAAAARVMDNVIDQRRNRHVEVHVNAE